MACYLNKIKNTTQTATTPTHPQTQTEVTTTDSPDYIDFHTFIEHTDPAKTRIKRDVPHKNNNNRDVHRQKRQILAAIGAIGGVLGTILGIFNQQEIHNILNHVSTLETNQNLIINVAHKNTKAIQHFGNVLDHLANVVNSLIA